MVNNEDIMDTNSDNYIVNCRCDTCQVQGPVVVLHHYGAPVLAQCKVCNEHAFEHQARADINLWLDGVNSATSEV